MKQFALPIVAAFFAIALTATNSSTASASGLLSQTRNIQAGTTINAVAPVHFKRHRYHRRHFGGRHFGRRHFGRKRFGRRYYGPRFYYGRGYHGPRYYGRFGFRGFRGGQK